MLVEIISSDLSDEIKSYMVEKLREIQIAIDEYQITGGGPIIDTVESIFGHVILNKEFQKASIKSPATENFWKFMGKIVLVTSFTVGVLQIPNEVKKYLPPAALVEINTEEERVEKSKEKERVKDSESVIESV